MKSDNKNVTPKPDERICHNCKNILWMIGLGQGLKCDLDKSNIPTRFHTCPKFEFKKKEDE